jgi:F0F1-type ATP synthase assembly protein I
MSSEFPNGRPQLEKKKAGGKYSYREYMPYLSLGFQLAVVIVVFYFLGDWIDRRYGCSPMGKLIGSAIGMTGGFINFFRSVNSLISNEEHKHEGKN